MHAPVLNDLRIMRHDRLHGWRRCRQNIRNKWDASEAIVRGGKPKFNNERAWRGSLEFSATKRAVRIIFRDVFQSGEFLAMRILYTFDYFKYSNKDAM